MSETEDQELKIYELTNLNTGEKQFSVSNNAQDACKQAGCIVGDCFVREVKPELRPRGDGHSVLMVKIPCRVCPYQFGEGVRPDTEVCPVAYPLLSREHLYDRSNHNTTFTALPFFITSYLCPPE